MTVAAVARTAGPYDTTGGETLLPYAFKVLAQSDLTVHRRRGGGNAVLVLNIDYTVSGVGSASGGNVVLTTAALDGDVYFIEGNRPGVRTSDVVYSRSLPAATVNAELDSLQIQLRELQDRIERAVMRSPFDDPDAAPLVLPPLEPGKVLGVDDDGNAIFTTGGSGGSASIPDPLPVDMGGTGGNTAGVARVNLGLGALATLASVATGNIDALSVTGPKLAAEAVTADKVAAGVRTTVVESWQVNTPPGSPAIGKVWIVGPIPTGAWATHQGKEARYADGVWTFRAPVAGDSALALAEQQTLAYDGTIWDLVGLGQIGAVTGRLVTALPSDRFGGGLTRGLVLDGNKVCIWGDGTGSKNAQAGARDAAAPELIPFQSPGVTTIKKLVAGDGRYFVIDQDDYVWSAGDGADYALGHEDEVDQAQFKRIAWFFSRTIKVRDIVIGRVNASDAPLVVFVTTTNTVYTTGAAAQGQRGDGTTTITPEPTQVSTTAVGNPAIANISSVSVGGAPHTVAAKGTDGKLYCWGFNGHGQLGDGTTTNATRAIEHPTLLTVAEVLACSSGAGGNVYVRRTDGVLLGCGTNSTYELAQGSGDTTNRSTLVTITCPETPASLFGGDGPGGTRGAVSVDGNIMVWGANTHSQHGDGTTTTKTDVTLLTEGFDGLVLQVAVGGAGTEALFVRTASAIWCAGYNAQLNTASGTSNATVSSWRVVIGVTGETIAELAVMGNATHYGPLIRYADGRLYTGGAGGQGELGWLLGTQGNAGAAQIVLIPGQRGQGAQGPPGPDGPPGPEGPASLTNDIALEAQPRLSTLEPDVLWEVTDKQRRRVLWLDQYGRGHVAGEVEIGTAAIESGKPVAYTGEGNRVELTQGTPTPLAVQAIRYNRTVVTEDKEAYAARRTMIYGAVANAAPVLAGKLHMHIPIIGQSLSAGSNGVAPYSQVPATAWPDNCLMLKRVAGHSDIRGGLSGASTAVTFTNTDFEDFTPIVEKAASSGTYGQTIAAGFAAFMQLAAKTDVGIPHRFSTITTGVGGQAYAALAKGTNPYNNTLQAVIAARNIVRRNGGQVVVPAIFNLHGESDVASATYGTDLGTWRTDYDGALKTYTAQTCDIPFILHQPSSFILSGNNGSHIQMVTKMKAEPRLFSIASASYFFHVRNFVDGLHLGADEYFDLGSYFWRAFRDEVLRGIGWSPLQPLSIQRVSNTEIRAVFHVPVAPLVLDTSTISEPVANARGFRIYSPTDTTVDIASVTVDGDDAVVIETSETIPTSAQLWYALNQQAATRDLANVPRGCLRDSDPTVSLRDGTSPLPNWCIHFNEAIPDAIT